MRVSAEGNKTLKNLFATHRSTVLLNIALNHTFFNLKSREKTCQGYRFLILAKSLTCLLCVKRAESGVARKTDVRKFCEATPGLGLIKQSYMGVGNE